MTKPEPAALIVGASRGLGFALVEEYLKQGWSVVATERSGTNTPLQQLARASEGRLEVERVDINHPDHWRLCDVDCSRDDSSCCSSTPASASESRSRMSRLTSSSA